MRAKSFNCVYASELLISDSGLLTTLALFYDKVSLPHPYDLDANAKPLIRWPFDKLDDLEIEQRHYRSWINANKELFNAGVLEVLPPPLEAQRDEPIDLAQRLLEELGSSLPYFTSSQVFSGKLALAMHALFSQTTDPEFITSRPGNTSTQHLQTVLATSLLEYQLPQLEKLHPEQILELREEVAPYKQGFIDYLSKMTDNVEQRLQSTANDANEAARRTVERVIIPEFNEFLAQELPHRVGWWAGLIQKTASTLSSVIKVVVTPWDMANYFDVAGNPFGLVEHFTDPMVERASNKHRAIQFINTIERVSGT
nr:MAG: hypothetical protein EDM05_13925 [Leptolyngbya sp. IPPAS B-1204]